MKLYVGYGTLAGPARPTLLPDAAWAESNRA